MAEPVRGSLVQEMRRHYAHSRDIATVLESLRRRFAEAGIPFAVVGAIALQHYGYVRHTEDIDIVTTREGLDKIHAVLVGRGIVPRGPGLRKRLRETEHVVNIDVITSGEHAGSQDSPVVYPPPDSDAFVEVEGLRYPTLESLITFKIASGHWGHRTHDLGDVQRLIRLQQLDERFADRLHPALRPTFLDLLTKSRLEREAE
jgi:hypothetical protein